MSCWEKLCDIDLLKQFLCYLAFCTKSIKQIVDLKKKYLNKRYFTRDIVVLGGPVVDWELGKSICASSYVFPSVTLKQCPSTVSLLCHFLLFHDLTNPLFLGKGRVWSIKLSALTRVVVIATDANLFSRLFLDVSLQLMTTIVFDLISRYTSVLFFWIFFIKLSPSFDSLFSNSSVIND